MMSLERTPSSIAARVSTGRQSIARRRSSMAYRLRRISSRLHEGTGARRGPQGHSSRLKGTLRMKLGVNVGYWGLGLTSEQQLEIVQEAERIGYDSVWAAEAYGSDTATVLAWLAAGTERIHLCAGIFQIPAGIPAMTAMTAATLDQLSGGRFRLGIGSSGPQVSEGWHGVRFANQLARTREYIAVVRKALARERLEFGGEHYELPLPDGPG